MTLLGREQLDHPALGTAGGAGLHASIATIYTNVGDDNPGRYKTYASVANSTVTTYTHNFGVAFADIRVRLYTGTHPNLVRVQDPVAAGWVIAAGATPKTQVAITAPSSGGPHTFAIVVLHAPAAEKLDELTDVDLTVAPEDGQGLVYDLGSTSWKPGASGDSSYKLGSVTGNSLILKGGYLGLTDGRELATYSGSGTVLASYGVDLTLNLDVVLGSTPANATNYYLYIDQTTLGAVQTISNTGRKVYRIVQANFFLSTAAPETIATVHFNRYLPIGNLLSASSGNAWSGAGSAFTTYSTKKHYNGPAWDQSVAAEDGQALVYDAGTLKYKPGASGDASFKLQSIATNVATVKAGSIILDDGRELYLATDISFNLKSAVNTAGVTAPASSTAYYVYLDTGVLPSQTSVGSADRKVFAISSGTSGQFIVFANTPAQIDLLRYVPLYAVKTNGSSDYVTTVFSNLSVRRHANLNKPRNDINYIANSDFERGTTTGWAAYKNTTPSATPENGTGGAPSTLTLSANPTSPMRGAYDFSIAKSAVSGLGEGARYNFSIDAPDKSKKLKIEFDLLATDANYVAGDLTVYVYDVTNSVLITPSSVSVPAASGTFQVTFDSTTSTSYRLIFHVATVSALAWTVKLDNIVVGPGTVVQGAAVSYLGNLAFTANGFGTVTSSTFYASRVGSMLRVQGRWNSGTKTATTASISLPTGYTLDAAALPASKYQMVGLWTNAEGGTQGIFGIDNGGPLFWDGSDTSKIYLSNQIASAGYLKLAGNVGVFDTAQVFQFEIPIAEWAGSGTVNLGANDVEYAYNTSTSDADDFTSFGYGPAGGLVPSTLTTPRVKRVRFPTPIQATDALLVEISLTQNSPWIPLVADDANIGVQSLLRQVNNFYGMALKSNSPAATDADVLFGTYQRITGGAYGAAGDNWSNNYYWRVRKSKAGVAVGFGLASATQSGLVTSYAPVVRSAVTTVTSANYTITDTDGYETVLVSTGASDRTITLPAVAANSGRALLIKKTDAGAGKVTVTPNGGNIDGISSFTLTAQYSKLRIVSDGTNWFIEQATGAAKCFAYRSGSQSIATSADVTVQLNATLFDTNSNFNTGTYRFVASREGYYQVAAQVFMSEEATANTYYSLQVTKNGTVVLNAYQTYNETGAQAQSNSVGVSGLVFLNVSDYLDLHTVHVSSGAKALGVGASATFLSILEILDK